MRKFLVALACAGLLVGCTNVNDADIVQRNYPNGDRCYVASMRYSDRIALSCVGLP